MPIFELSNKSIIRLNTTTFSKAGILERGDLQRLLRDQIEVVAPGVLIISEEFGEWTDSRSRIDLLGVDKDANLVVFELKRTEDGGHMELQAIRYASMVSTLTAERAVEIFGGYLTGRGRVDEPEQLLLEFLEWDELDEEQFGQDVRIVLISGNFSRELTTTVLWLNEKDHDIRCVRIQPYEYDGHTLIDVQQVIPLAETADYQVQVREKKRQEGVARKSNADFTRYDITINGETHLKQWKRNAILLIVKALHENKVNPHEVNELFRTLGRGNTFLIIDSETENVDEFKTLAADLLEHQGKSYNDRRWHTSPGDLLISNGKTYALTKIWGQRWLKFMEVLQQDYPQIGLKYSPTEVV